MAGCGVSGVRFLDVGEIESGGTAKEIASDDGDLHWIAMVQIRTVSSGVQREESVMVTWGGVICVDVVERHSHGMYVYRVMKLSTLPSFRRVTVERIKTYGRWREEAKVLGFA